MITEVFASIKDNLKRRATNPFLGTFTIVYIIRNWELFYGLINFDDNFKLENKLNYVRGYFNIHSFGLNLLECIGYSILVMISTYIFLGLGRYLSNLYSAHVEPWLFKITDKGKIVLKEEYKNMFEEKIKFEAKYENERIEKSNIIKSRDEMESRYLNMLASNNESEIINNLKAEIETLRSQVNSMDDENESLKKQNANKDNFIKKLETEFNAFEEPSNNSTKLVNKIYKEIMSKNYENTWIEVLRRYSKNQSISMKVNGSEMDYFIDRNLIKIVSTSLDQNLVKIALTPLGESLRELFILKGFSNEEKS